MTYDKDQLQLILEGWKIVLDEGDEHPNAYAKNDMDNGVPMNDGYVGIMEGEHFLDHFGVKAMYYLAIGIMGRHLSKSEKAQQEMDHFVNLVR